MAPSSLLESFNAGLFGVMAVAQSLAKALGLESFGAFEGRKSTGLGLGFGVFQGFHGFARYLCSTPADARLPAGSRERRVGLASTGSKHRAYRFVRSTQTCPTT